MTDEERINDPFWAAYDEYMSSPEWETRKWKFRDGECDTCGGVASHLHHVRYPNAYQARVAQRERGLSSTHEGWVHCFVTQSDADFMWLCESCHGEIHRLTKPGEVTTAQASGMYDAFMLALRTKTDSPDLERIILDEREGREFASALGQFNRHVRLVERDDPHLAILLLDELGRRMRKKAVDIVAAHPERRQEFADLVAAHPEINFGSCLPGAEE